jgi:hypothetical protein
MKLPLEVRAVAVGNCDCCGNVSLYFLDATGAVIAFASMPLSVSKEIEADIQRKNVIAEAMKQGRCAEVVGHG